MSDGDTQTEVTYSKLLVASTRALADRFLRWAAVLMAFGVTGVILYRPQPWRVGAGALFIGLIAPLWLRRPRKD